ncbi:hypothetical protein [Luteolibacter luteus]|uniref:PepSY domain-containing protein n=1 Tax=Luteolibacter luteus TaxID=2728835 RepID=A0A858RP07_9BACT|nr:hypothetical protein [Luteolibacter luteus]QJE98148.1 hypothetical protein HHL09_20950 [Luteolibacter luteus]
MKRLEFLRLCALAGVAGSTGIASAESNTAHQDLQGALKAAGITGWDIREEGETLYIRCKVSDFDALSRKASSLGDGKVKAKGNTFTFERQGRSIQLDLRA